MMTLAKYLRQINLPRIDAECIIMHALNKPRAFLYAYPDTPISTEEQKIIEALVAKRLQGEPIAYLLGHQEFWSLDFKVTPDTLIPRPETEHLVEWVLARFTNETLRVADLGVGCGAIALSLAYEKPRWAITAVDQSSPALKIAQYNATQYDLNNIEFKQGSWCQALMRHDYDLIISNPPYIANNDPHLQGLTYEPQSALCAGEDGLDDIRIIISEAQKYLNASGVVVLEHGYDQGKKVAELFAQAGYRCIENHIDLAGHTRFTSASV